LSFFGERRWHLRDARYLLAVNGEPKGGAEQFDVSVDRWLALALSPPRLGVGNGLFGREPIDALGAQAASRGEPFRMRYQVRL
jgi:hypothetical protein